MKQIATTAAILALFILVLPATIVIFLTKNEQALMPKENAATKVEETYDITIPVFRAKKETVEKHPLEQYVMGVVASEMPASFEMEALKAQALAARTYIVKQMLEENDIALPDGAVVTDTANHQVFQNEKELMEKWQKDFHWKMARIKEAVEATSGEILTYNGEPIEASFFSTSNGYTENSEDYWQSAIPYLRAVESPWDAGSPKFKNTLRIPVSEFEEKLGVTVKSDSVGEILERTKSKRVKKVSINGKIFSGREIREKLQLPSTDFTWRKAGNEIVIETKGWGHGVGMSQYGANGMAKEGKTYEEIVRYYYQNVEITTLSPFVAKLTAKSVSP